LTSQLTFRTLLLRPAQQKNDFYGGGDRTDSEDIVPVDWNQFYRTRLPEFLDGNGDLAPPWERFPGYERYTIGWRMGAGEDWLCLWHVFLEDLDPAFDARLAYLRRHPPAPVTWADWVHCVLYSSSREVEREDEEEAAAERRTALQQAGLIASDVAYSTWLSQQQGVRCPWESAETPEMAARYGTRDLWFWSRQVAGLRSDPAWVPPAVPERWQPCAAPLKTGEVRVFDLHNGLLALAQMLSAGRVTAPWQLGLTLDDFADSFEDDMGYVDAFRLWEMSSFDDREQLQQYLTATNVPEVWERWTVEQFLMD
jgi:hypothetical protein